MNEKKRRVVKRRARRTREPALSQETKDIPGSTKVLRRPGPPKGPPPEQPVIEKGNDPVEKCPIGFLLCGESECRWWSDLNSCCTILGLGDESYHLRIQVTRVADTLRELQETGESLVRAIGGLKDAASGTSSSVAKLTDLVESRLELEQLERGKG